MSKISEMLVKERMSYAELGRTIGLATSNLSLFTTGKIALNCRFISSIIEDFVMDKYNDPKVVDELYESLKQMDQDIKIAFYHLPLWVKERFLTYIIESGLVSTHAKIKDRREIDFSEFNYYDEIPTMVKALKYALQHHNLESLRFISNRNNLTCEEISRSFRFESIIIDISTLQGLSLMQLSKRLKVSERAIRTLKSNTSNSIDLNTIIPLIEYIKEKKLPELLMERIFSHFHESRLDIRVGKGLINLSDVPIDTFDYFNRFLVGEEHLRLLPGRGKKVRVHYGSRAHKVIVEKLKELVLE